MQIGIIGCGNMGGGMARQILSAGHALSCYDPDDDKLDILSRLGATSTTSAGELAKGSQVILLSLPRASVVEAVVQDMLPHIQPGTIILDTSTSEPATSQSMARLGETQGFSFVDGPVSGGPAAAHAGTMTMLLGGTSIAIEALTPLLDIITTKTVIVGAAGAGHAAKIANNMLCAANLVLVAEAVRLGEAAGVSPESLLEGINAGSGRSGVSEVNFPKWVLNQGFDSGFTMELMRKDVRLAIDLAESSKVQLGGFAPIADIWLNQSGAIPDNADFNEIVKYHNGDNNV
ncbi:MAG: NAD(P)-dependent oxidoreductase [Granulosicoccus sp.]